MLTKTDFAMCNLEYTARIIQISSQLNPVDVLKKKIYVFPIRQENRF
jgi:hypothetical protein